MTAPAITVASCAWNPDEIHTWDIATGNWTGVHVPLDARFHPESMPCPEHVIRSLANLAVQREVDPERYLGLLQDLLRQWPQLQANDQ